MFDEPTKDPQRQIRISTLRVVDGLPFGAAIADLQAMKGQPDKALQNYTGEWELLYGDAFFRFFAGRFVEATFPACHRFVIDGAAVLAPYPWLAGCPDMRDVARFRIAPSVGLAFDNRDPANGSLTAFEAGRWDALL